MKLKKLTKKLVDQIYHWE